MLEALARAVLDAAEGLGVPPIGRLAEIDNRCTPHAVSEREHDRLHPRKEYLQDTENTSQKVGHS